MVQTGDPSGTIYDLLKFSKYQNYLKIQNVAHRLPQLRRPLN